MCTLCWWRPQNPTQAGHKMDRKVKERVAQEAMVRRVLDSTDRLLWQSLNLSEPEPEPLCIK